MRNSTSSMHPFEADLLPMLARAAREATVPLDRAIAPPFRWWRRVALVVGAGVCLAVVAPLFSDDPLRGALAVKRRGDTVYVSVKDATADPETMTNDLRAQGLPATVEVIPVSPSLEGAWVDIVNDNLAAGYNDPRFVDIFQQITEWPSELAIPADFSTPFTLRVGRPAEPGETYAIALAADTENAFECLGLKGLTPAEAEESIARQGYEVLWYFQRSDIPETEVLDEVPIDKVIIGAEFLGPTKVIVHTADPRSGDVPESESQAEAPTTSGC